MTATLLLPHTHGTAVAAPSGPVLVLTADTDGDGSRGLYRAEVSDPSARTAILSDTDQVDVEQAKLSPDGSRVAVLLDPTGYSNSYSLQVMNLNGTGRHTVFAGSWTSTTFAEVEGFDWAPDGTALVYGLVSGSATSAAAKLMRVNASGTPTPTAVPGGADAVLPVYDSTGAHLAALVPYDDGSSDLVRIDAVTGADALLRTTSSADVSSLAWTPDDSQVVLSLAVAADQAKLIGVAADGSDATFPDMGTLIVDNASGDIDDHPAFAADGTLWFDRYDQVTASSELMSTTYDSGTSHWTAPVARTSTPTADEAAPAFGPADVTAPSAPVFQPFTLVGTSVRLAWTNPASADFSHVVVVRDDGLRIYAGSAQSATDTHARVGTTHQYLAVASDGAGNASAVSSRQATALNRPRVVVPNPTSSAGWRGKAFPVTWSNGNPAGTRSTVQWSYKSGTTWALVAARTWLAGTTATTASFGAGGAPTTPALGQTYYFRAVASDAYGNTTGYTPWSGASVPLDQTSGHLGPYSTSGFAEPDAIAWLGSERGIRGGEWISFTATSKGFAVIGERNSGWGWVKVYVNGTYVGRFNAGATPYAMRAVLWRASYSTIAKRTVKLVADPHYNGFLVDGLATPR
jgi:hypothetical protein